MTRLPALETAAEQAIARTAVTGTPGYLGATAISEGKMQINCGAAVTLHAISGAGGAGGR